MTTPKRKSSLGNVKIPKTGYDWQLYTASMPCGTAARALHTAAIKAGRLVLRGESMETAMSEVLRPVMEKYASHGACDTEPRNVAIAFLEAMYFQRHGYHRSYN